MNDTLLFQNCNNLSEKICVPKLLLGCSMGKLHNDLISKSSTYVPDSYIYNRKPIMSDTTLRSLLQPNVT